MNNKVLKKKIESSALKAIRHGIIGLPFNRSSSYIMVHLKNAKCDLFIPVLQREDTNMQTIKDAWQSLIDAAEL